MNRYILAAAFLLCTSPTFAQNAGDSHEMVRLHYKSGDTKSFLKSDVRSISFESVSKLYERRLPVDLYFNCSAETYEQGYGVLVSSSEISVETDADWVVAKLMDYEQRGHSSFDEDEYPWMVYVDGNTSLEPRYATIQFTNQEGDSISFNVIQNGYDMHFGFKDAKAIYDKQAYLWKQDTLYGNWDYVYWYVNLVPNHHVTVESVPDWLELDSSTFVQYSTSDFEEFKTKPYEEEWAENSSVYFYSQINTSGKTLEGDIVFAGLYGQKVLMHVIQPTLDNSTAMSFLTDIQYYMAENNCFSSRKPVDFSYMAARITYDRMTGDVVPLKANGYDWFSSASELDIHPTSNLPYIIWASYYNIIIEANKALYYVDFCDSLQNAAFIKGNAYAYRALALMELVQTFQNPYDGYGRLALEKPGVPILLTEQEEALMDTARVEYLKGRNTVEDVLMQAYSDLNMAIGLLEGQQRPDKNFIDVNVAYGLMARLMLMAADWTSAAMYAQKALDGYRVSYSIGDGFNSIDDKEVMWGYAMNEDNANNLGYASFPGWMSNVSKNSYVSFFGTAFNERIVNDMSESDRRSESWANDSVGYSKNSYDSYFANNPYAQWKFVHTNVWDEDNYIYADNLYMRASEMVLIQAEASLNILLEQRYNGSEVPNAIKAILQERERELIGEGFSLFDHKRTGLPIIRGANDQYLPGEIIESDDIRLTLPLPYEMFGYSLFNLTEDDQNPGY